MSVIRYDKSGVDFRCIDGHARAIRSRTRNIAVACALAALLVPPANAAELKPETGAAFDSYIRVTEQQRADELRTGHFFVLDNLPDSKRQRIYTQLRQGEVYIEPLHTKQDGTLIRVPRGLIHHWVGVAFISDGTLSRTIAVLQNYENHKNLYKPDVRRSKLLEHQGSQFKVYLQLYRKSLVTVVLNLNVNVQYTPLSTTRAMSRSYSTRIAEVENAGKPNERELPVGNDHGYLWRLNNYWRIEEKDGGVYVQVESVGLSRTIPWTVAWLVNPLIRSIPQNTLSGLLNATRAAVVNAAETRPESSLPAVDLLQGPLLEMLVNIDELSGL